ncbi:hypothetical protein XH98_13035 [Bradyrhizobium sp. CCBAU 51745]|nr:hypothetical protein [Bradyrhizobium sp. CCBAU 51745]
MPCTFPSFVERHRLTRQHLRPQAPARQVVPIKIMALPTIAVPHLKAAQSGTASCLMRRIEVTFGACMPLKAATQVDRKRSLVGRVICKLLAVVGVETSDWKRRFEPHGVLQPRIQFN